MFCKSDVFSDNRNTFEQKLERLISLISRDVGLPSLARKAFKFLVRKVSDIFVSGLVVTNL